MNVVYCAVRSDHSNTLEDFRHSQEDTRPVLDCDEKSVSVVLCNFLF